RPALHASPTRRSSDLAFNDVHAAMSFVCTGRNAECEHVVARQRGVLRQAEEAAGDNAFFLREVGHDATRAIAAFGDGRYAECVRSEEHTSELQSRENL